MDNCGLEAGDWYSLLFGFVVGMVLFICLYFGIGF